MQALIETMLEFVREHSAFAPLVAFVLAFGESLAFVSLLLPATALLLAGGGIVSAASVGFWPVWIGAVAGAILGDWLSYWLGRHYGRPICRLWPLSRHPTLVQRGERFFRKWGIASVLLGRFFGPLRCVMPLVAGICAMPFFPFQAANVLSALIWATAVLTPGRLAPFLMSQ